MPDDSEQRAFAIEAQLLGRLDGMIRTNLDLVGQRMGWLLISQSFLFTALVLAAANIGRAYEGLPKHVPYGDILQHLLLIIPSIGMLTTISSRWAWSRPCASSGG